MILITGAGGIVGSELCQFLQEKNLDYLGIIRAENKYKNYNYMIWDLNNPLNLNDKFINSVSFIIHLAAAVPHSKRYGNNEESALITRNIDLNVYNLQKNLDVPLIYMSTCGLYNKKLNCLMKECDEEKLLINSPYFKAKLEGENLFNSNSKSTILRLSAPIGFGLKNNLVLPNFIEKVRSGLTIDVWGNGNREQNFIDTRDIADVIVKIIKKPQYETFNIAGKESISMKNLAKLIIKIAKKGKYRILFNNDPNEGNYANYSIEKAKNLVGWSPKYNIEKSVERILKDEFDND